MAASKTKAPAKKRATLALRKPPATTTPPASKKKRAAKKRVRVKAAEKAEHFVQRGPDAESRGPGRPRKTPVGEKRVQTTMRFPKAIHTQALLGCQDRRASLVDVIGQLLERELSRKGKLPELDTTGHDKSQATIRLPHELHAKARKRCIEHKQVFGDVVAALLQREFEGA